MHRIAVPLLIADVALPSFSHAEGVLTYKPPQTGAPSARIGGGTRGLSLAVPEVQLLAPKHTALTAQAQPTLFWYLSKPNPGPFKITVIKTDTDQPLLETQLPAPAGVGIQRIALADHGVTLQAGDSCRWSVSLLDSTGNGSAGTATLLYQPPAAPLANVEQQAEAGYWYDVLQQLISEHSPLTNDLLEQVGIQIPEL